MMAVLFFSFATFIIFDGVNNFYYTRNMLIKGIVILTCFFVDSSSSQQEQFSLADSGYCQYDAPRPYYQASCSNASVPMDLDFTGLPERLTRLLLTNLTVHHTYSPISPGPSYADLQRGRKMTVHLFEIIYVGLKNNTRLPFSQLLQHVASIIISLTIEQTFIGDLGNGDLEGFLALTELRFVECGIASLHPKLFYPLAYSNRLSWIPSELLQPGARSILRSLDLQRNKLRLLKWEVLRPISSSIEVISVDDNEVNEIVEPEYGAMNNFQKLYYFSIVRNRLKTIPLSIFSVFQPGAYIVVTNNFIPCDKCYLLPFLGLINRGVRVENFTCIWSISQKSQSLNLLSEAANAHGNDKCPYYLRGQGVPQKGLELYLTVVSAWVFFSHFYFF